MRKLPENTTNTEWEQYFKVLRLMINPCSETKMRSRYSYSINNQYDGLYFQYDGDTQWVQYCRFINSILSTIRRGKCDYCYYVYQIADLLRYEHDNLEAVWLPEYQCFKVYLNSCCNKNFVI